MVGPTKNEALSLFSYAIPGYQFEGVWLDGEPRTTPENAGLLLPGRELFTAPLPWAKFKASKVSVPVVTNVETWETAALWSAQDGSIVNADPPVWDVREITMAQLAVQLTVDTAVDVDQSDYDVYGAALRALSEMMMTAMYRQLCSKAPDANGPRSFYNLAVDESKVVNASGASLSFDMLMCLRQQVDVNTGSPAQFSLVLGRDLYADFVAMMTGVGHTPEMDPVTNEKQWFFDRIRVVESGYVDDGNAMVIKSDLSVLPDELRRADAAGVRRGAAIISDHGQGVVVKDMAANESSDQSTTALQLNVALIHCDGCVGWIENVGT